MQPVLDEPGVLVVGSEVPNLLQPDAASILVVSQDVDVAVPARTRNGASHLLENRGDSVSRDLLLDKMRARARAVRARTAIRRWEYRQRGLAAGVWFRLRRVLADAKEAYVISADDAKQLITEGYKAEECGAQLAPEKTIIFVDSARLARIESRRRIPVRLSPDFLLATEVALLSF